MIVINSSIDIEEKFEIYLIDILMPHYHFQSHFKSVFESNWICDAIKNNLSPIASLNVNFHEVCMYNSKNINCFKIRSFHL